MPYFHIDRMTAQIPERRGTAISAILILSLARRIGETMEGTLTKRKVRAMTVERSGSIR